MQTIAKSGQEKPLKAVVSGMQGKEMQELRTITL